MGKISIFQPVLNFDGFENFRIERREGWRHNDVLDFWF